MKYLWKFFLRISGWTWVGQFPLLPKYIIIVGPHTSNMDFILGLAFRNVCGISSARFLGKESLFRPPMGKIFKWLGGIAVKRNTRADQVKEVVKLFEHSDKLILALSPEGTRSRTERLRTGFYHIARGAGVPIVMAAMDYNTKRLVIADPFYPGPDEKKDFRTIIDFFAKAKGKYAANDMTHLVNSPLYH